MSRDAAILMIAHTMLVPHDDGLADIAVPADHDNHMMCGGSLVGITSPQ